MTAPAPTKSQRIANLFLSGYSLDLVAEHGMAGGWGRADARQVVEANGWTLDASGRIPRELRTAPSAPVRAVPTPRPAQPTPAAAPVRPPVDDTAALIGDGKAHSVARVRKLAERAEETLAQLRRAIQHEAGREQIRQRLAELDAERDRLRAQLGGPGRPTKPRPATPATGSGKPINHGTWGGYMAHRKRGEDACTECETAKDSHLAGLRARKAAS